MAVAGGWEEEEGRVLEQWGQFQFYLRDEKSDGMDGADGCTTTECT